MTGDMEGERINQSLVQHLKSKLHEERNKNFILYQDLKAAQLVGGTYQSLWNGLKREMSNTFATHPLNPQLLHAYMEGQEALAKAEQEE